MVHDYETECTVWLAPSPEHDQNLVFTFIQYSRTILTALQELGQMLKSSPRLQVLPRSVSKNEVLEIAAMARRYQDETK